MSAAASPAPGASGHPAGRAPGAEFGWELAGLALARGELDRATIRRADADWVESAWADPGSRVLVLSRGKAPVRSGAAEPALVLVTSAAAPAGERFLLGVDDAGIAYFGVAAAGAAAEPTQPGRPVDTRPPASGEVRAMSLREAGPLLGDRDAGLFTHAVALANWHATHQHCPRCGAPTRPLPAGHARVCTADGSEHFPRTDPAVIMLVTDADGRCLLARNARWPERRVSILAGFLEPGESAEHAVIREVAEETGIVVAGVQYLGSQPWPMPQSLMLGFRAQAASGQEIRVDAEEISEARWFSQDELRAAMAAGEVLLPPPVSIAHQIIQAWYGEPLPRSW